MTEHIDSSVEIGDFEYKLVSIDYVPGLSPTLTQPTGTAKLPFTVFYFRTHKYTGRIMDGEARVWFVIQNYSINEKTHSFDFSLNNAEVEHRGESGPEEFYWALLKNRKDDSKVQHWISSAFQNALYKSWKNYFAITDVKLILIKF
jgi:hypothetical protein